MGYGIIWLSYVISAFRQKSRLVWLLVAAVSTVLAFFSINFLLINFGLMLNPLPDMLALRIALLLELTILSAGWFYRRKLLQRARQQLEIQNRHLQADVIHNQEAERQRIATDLHDDLGGTLATIRRRISDIRLNLIDPQVAHQFDDLEPLIQKTSDDLRRIAHNLMPPEFMRIGLRDSLRQLINSQPDHPTRFTFIVAGDERVLPLEAELNIYRIISELVHNINKHAQAKRAALQLMYQDENLTITLEDDGLGSQATKTHEDNAGIGLKNSILRADYIGARLWREVSIGGTLVVLDVPYSTTPDAPRRPDPNPVDR
jgi:signal transduction histidine kinase